jgi:hypothetical protein
VIVVPRAGRLLLIDQLDHAALAGELAAVWGNAGFDAPEPRESVVLAASRHDEGWREWDDEVRFDPVRRGPLHFLNVDISDYVRLYARGIARIADLDPYAGALTSMHGTGNVCGRWGLQRGIRLSAYDEATWPAVIQEYVLAQEVFQARLKLGILGLNPERRRALFERRLWANYESLQAWDRLSLFLCRTDPDQPSEAELGVVPTLLESCQSRPLLVRSSGAGKAVVMPWPFAVETLEVAVRVRTVTDREYKSPEDAYAEVKSAPPGALSWILTGEGSN